MRFLTITFLFWASITFAQKKPERILSLAPSITEILCSLELQNKIVGVTDFCKDPYKKTDFSKKKIGGILNPGFERILKSRPDIIFTLKGKSDHGTKLEKYGFKVVRLDHVNLDGLFNSINVIGKTCGEEQKAAKLLNDLKKHFDEKPKTQNQTVLITISRLSSQSNIRLWVAGNDGFYSRLLEQCGVKNAVQNKEKFSQISVEGLIRLNPDKIILLRDKMSPEEQTLEIKFWKKIPGLKALKNNEFHIITGDEIMIPGPRFPKVLEKFKKVINNE